MKKSFKVYRQLESMDCGPSCLRMIAKHYGKAYALNELKELTRFSRTGVSAQGIMDAAERIGMESITVQISMNELMNEAPKPCILHWGQSHYVVLPPQDSGRRSGSIRIADPELGMVSISPSEFEKKWLKTHEEGVAILLHPTEDFFRVTTQKSPNGFRFLSAYVGKYKWTLIKVLCTLAITSGFTLLFPLLTQNLVDEGIVPKNKHIVFFILLAQVALFMGNVIMEIGRSWWLLHMNTRINIKIVSDFLIKLARLPLQFFDARRVGDIQQRILDHNRIEQLLSASSLNILFSFINLIIFSVILAGYHIWLLLIFVVMSAMSVIWIFIFLKKRKELDLIQFSLNSQNQNLLNELVLGMPEIKLNTAESWQQKTWEEIQTDLYRRNIQSLKLSQYQQIGASFFTQLKNILITFLCALFVMDGQMTLGMLLAVSFIIGQMNSPLDQILSIIEIGQDAKLSLERLAEVHQQEEEQDDQQAVPIPHQSSIVLENVGFRYHSEWVLKNISCSIPRGKVTAIVGASGSGKTTLLKLLLRFYEPDEGHIMLGDIPLPRLLISEWRQRTGVVMQDGFIFSDTITKNIVLHHDDYDQELLDRAIAISNLKEPIQKLPLGAATKIGNNGVGLSMGQKQRILLARAIYKNPEFIFFDEATSALDAVNEREIMNQLKDFYQDKTVLIIAHRLSTIRNADQIIVLDNGILLESGTHQSLMNRQGKYYTLISNQLDLQ